LNLLLSKSRIERAERKWRHFVFGKGFHILFWPWIVIFLVSALVPRSVAAVVMMKVLPLWFCLLLLLIVSSYSLTFAVAVRRRQIALSVWIMLVMVLICWIIRTIGMFAIS